MNKYTQLISEIDTLIIKQNLSLENLKLKQSQIQKRREKMVAQEQQLALKLQDLKTTLNILKNYSSLVKSIKKSFAPIIAIFLIFAESTLVLLSFVLYSSLSFVVANIIILPCICLLFKDLYHKYTQKITTIKENNTIKEVETQIDIDLINHLNLLKSIEMIDIDRAKTEETINTICTIKQDLESLKAQVEESQNKAVNSNPHIMEELSLEFIQSSLSQKLQKLILKLPN